MEGAFQLGVLHQLAVTETDPGVRVEAAVAPAHKGVVPLRSHDEVPAQLGEVHLKRGCSSTEEDALPSYRGDSSSYRPTPEDSRHRHGDDPVASRPPIPA